MPFAFLSVRMSAVVFAAAALGSCAQPARPLPPDVSGFDGGDRAYVGSLSSADQALSCAEIGAEQRANEAAREKLTAEIASKRAVNPAALYLGALFVVPLLAVDRANEEAAALERLAERRDILLRLRSHRKCP